MIHRERERKRERTVGGRDSERRERWWWVEGRNDSHRNRPGVGREVRTVVHVMRRLIRQNRRPSAPAR